MSIRFVLIALAIMGIFVLAACGDGDRAATRDADDAAAEPEDAVAQQEETEDEAVAQADEAGIDLSSLADGWYRAAEAYDAGEDWRNIVMVEVRDGEIVDATWTAAPKTGGTDKMTRSIDGDYGMERVAQWPWHEQAEAAIDHLIETQDPTAVELNEGGEADAISGATMTVSYFFELAEEALSGEPDGFGPYEDGVYRAEGEPGDDWQDVVHVTVVDGYIVSVHWAPEPTGDQGMDKYEYSVEGEYGMERVSQWPWHEQADTVARYVIENQSVDAIELDDEGETDAISGATITLTGFYNQAQAAIAQAQ